MIPLLHFLTILNAFVCLIAVRRLFTSYKKARNPNVGNFLKAYISLGLYFILISLPGLVFFNPYWIQVIYIISYFFLYLAPLFLLRAAFSIFKFSLANYFSFLIILIIIITAVLNIIFFAPARFVFIDDLFYFWGEGTPTPVRVSNGVLVTLLTMGCVIFFFFGGKNAQDVFVRNRSFLISGGLLILIVAAFLNYVVNRYISSREIPIFSGLLSLFGLIIMIRAIYYKADL